MRKYIQSTTDLVLSFYYQNEKRDREITPHKKTKSGHHANQYSEKMSLHCLFCTMTTRLFIHNKKSIPTTIDCQDLNSFFDWRQQKKRKKTKKLNVYFPVMSGFLSTTMTESPRRNILEMYRSLFTGLDFFFPLPLLGTSVHISFTFSNTMLQCL